ncbi:MAG: hypothetical protein ACHQVK_00265, partial [Candidatus Paceibacterales bacterium]
MNRYFFKHVSLVLAVVVTLIPFSAGAVSVFDLQTQLNALQSQLAQIQGQNNVPAVCSTVTFSRTLKVGMSGPDVKCLQSILNQNANTRVVVSGAGSPGFENTMFGARTKIAVIKFQQLYASQILTPAGLLRGTGIVGPSTLAVLNSLLKPAVATLPPATSNSVTGTVTSSQNQTQTQLTEAAIAKAAPAVVSVVITKDVPQYQVQYQNPFGNDPFFQNFNVQVPVYTPTGQTTQQKIGAGTGFLISQDGYILTNKHVVFDDQAIYTVTLASGATQT